MDKRILLVDDDKDIVMIVTDTLIDLGYEVDNAYDGQEAYDMLADNKYDLIILDVNMPKVSGIEFCSQVREMSSIPIIFLSAMDEEMDKIKGLDAGGDDYISKPFSLKELTSRVNSLMRRSYGGKYNNSIIHVGNIEINPSSRTVTKNGNEVRLSVKEFDVLLYLARNKNSTVKKETLFNEVWGLFSDCEVATLSVHIRWLREKLEDDPAKPEYIKTVWGIGFSLCDGDCK